MVKGRDVNVEQQVELVVLKWVARPTLMWYCSEDDSNTLDSNCLPSLLKQRGFAMYINRSPGAELVKMGCTTSVGQTLK